MAQIETQFSRDRRVAHIVLNRADKANALTQAMWSLLEESLLALADDPIVRVVVLQSASEVAFSAGADIAELAQMLDEPSRFSDSHAQVQRTQQALYRLPQTTLAVIRGACVGGGLGLALACDFRVADRSARFALTPAKLGLCYSLLDTRRLHRVVGAAVAREMLMLATTLPAERALGVGLIQALHAPADLNPAVDALLGTLATASSVSLRSIKSMLLKIEDGQAMEDAQSQALFAAAFGQADFARAAQAFVDKAPVSF